jgi:hypothetical protein
MRDMVHGAGVRIPCRVDVALLTTMSAEGNNRVCSHSNLLLSVTTIIADAEEVTVEPLEALGGDMTRYAT